MLNFLKKIFPTKLKMFIGKLISKSTLFFKTNKAYMIWNYCRKRNALQQCETRPILYLLGIPNHPNLGDQAIAYAERLFLESNLKSCTLVEIYDDDFFKVILSLKKLIKPNDVIAIHGGGNMGIDYFWCEKVRRTVITNFPKNKVVIFPQTIDFGLSKHGLKELQKSIAIYNKHSKLFIAAREEVSYERMKKYFPQSHIELVPDIVFFLNQQVTLKRSGALLCFRNDREKVFRDEDFERVLQLCEQNDLSVKITDTVLPKAFDLSQKEQVLKQKWHEFSSAQVVFTDRLHGMVFAAITSTPCVVFSNFNHKVKGTYEWIKENHFIKYADSTDCLDDLYHAVKKEQNIAYTNEFSLVYYKKIINFIESVADNEQV